MNTHPVQEIEHSQKPRRLMCPFLILTPFWSHHYKYLWKILSCHFDIIFIFIHFHCYKVFHGMHKQEYFHFTVDGHLGCFLFKTIVHNVVMSRLRQSCNQLGLAVKDYPSSEPIWQRPRKCFSFCLQAFKEISSSH